MNGKISVLIADNQCIAREGLKSVLADVSDFSVIAEVQESRDLVQSIKYNKPDVVVMDYDSPGFFQTSDIEVIRKTLPDTKILIISSDLNRSNIYKVLEYGVKNFLTKACDRDEIVKAVYAAANDEKFFCSKVIDIILEKHLHKDEEHCEPSVLSRRENEIITHIAEGLTNKEIAAKLHLSPHTISTHRKNIMKKLRINSVSEIVKYAIRLGLIRQYR